MNKVFALTFFAMATSLNAKTLSFPSFQIDVPAGWERSIEDRPDYDRGSVVSLRHPDCAGSLTILPYEAPAAVSQDRLRNMTNVDASTPLTWQKWGDFPGFQYDYIESGSLYRQWWLVKEHAMLFITYQCDSELRVSDTEAIDNIVRSIVVRNS
jgi:hypothetical protein